MPVIIGRIKKSGVPAVLHTCEECGSNAHQGFGVRCLEALKALEDKELLKAKRLLGKWYCSRCLTNSKKEI